MAVAEVMVAEVIEKLKDVGLIVGAQKTLWMSHPKMVDKSIMVDGCVVDAMASMAPMVVVDSMASRVAEATLNRWSRLGLFVMVKKMVLCASAGMAEARRNTKVSGLVSMMCWDTTVLGKWLCLLTVIAPKANFWLFSAQGDNDILKDCRVSKAGGLRWRRWLRWCGWHKGALTWKSSGDEWRRMAASGGDWWFRWVAGPLTQRVLTWKSFCVPSGEGGTHRRRLVFLLDREQINSCFRPCFVDRILRQLLCSLFDRLQSMCVSQLLS